MSPSKPAGGSLPKYEERSHVRSDYRKTVTGAAFRLDRSPRILHYACAFTPRGGPRRRILDHLQLHDEPPAPRPRPRAPPELFDA